MVVVANPVAVATVEVAESTVEDQVTKSDEIAGSLPVLEAVKPALVMNIREVGHLIAKCSQKNKGGAEVSTRVALAVATVANASSN
ncbi:hypothetical protein PI125_g23021 [Phytophthora idaei]|nr:hypothetical protein PI125_g23021 [Phytophthora idaei]